MMSNDVQGTRGTTTVQAPAAAPVPFADPGALGLAAFALTTFVLSFVNAGLVPATVEPVVFGLALFYGGLAQFAAGIWEFANRNTFGATAFCSYGAFWMAFWFLARFTDLKGAGADAGKGVAVFLLAWGIFTLYMTFAARRTTMAIFLVFVFLTVTFFALALGEYTATTAYTRIGGVLGIVTALLAWYGSFAVVLNSTHKRVVLPVGPQ
ncbi:succinate-acetate/proton symporter SatP [mine drainage metagenome]|uniref:Succinate-acetate/proton symporter SatP n=1 Tax=mine drainage metagenome TaxID=410659 RepID=A0A1J5QNT2_9ZZZZ